MNVMFESGQFFVRIQNKGGYPNHHLEQQR